MRRPQEAHRLSFASHKGAGRCIVSLHVDKIESLINNNTIFGAISHNISLKSNIQQPSNDHCLHLQQPKWSPGGPEVGGTTKKCSSPSPANVVRKMNELTIKCCRANNYSKRASEQASNNIASSSLRRAKLIDLAGLQLPGRSACWEIIDALSQVRAAFNGR